MIFFIQHEYAQNIIYKMACAFVDSRNLDFIYYRGWKKSKKSINAEGGNVCGIFSEINKRDCTFIRETRVKGDTNNHEE